MGGTPRRKDKPGPSYLEGKLRGDEIAELQYEDFSESDLAAVVKRATKVERKD